MFSGFLGVLPQNPQTLFVKKTVELDLLEMLDPSVSKEEQRRRVDEVAKLMHIEELMDVHPYDLSGGEQQRAALGKVLLLNPTLLLLDEPTKGIDNYFKKVLGEILRDLQSRGATILIVSHDVEFCARYANRCSLFFNGSCIVTDEPGSFFSGNSFYTTSANRMSRHIFKDAVTTEEVIKLCILNRLSNTTSRCSKKDPQLAV